MLPPDGDYLGSAAKVAPPKSFVALFEAQFQALAASHEKSAFCDDEDRGIEKALAEASSQEPVPVDDVAVGNRLEMALTRTQIRGRRRMRPWRWPAATSSPAK